MNYKPSYKYIPPITWSFLTPFYDFFCAIGGLGGRFKMKILDSVALSDGLVVADIGCGTGVFLKVAKQKHPRVTFMGLDPDRQALAIAERRLAKANLDVELTEAFAESLPLADGSVDMVFSTLAFHHMPDEIKQKAIREIFRILKPGGFVVITDFGPSSKFLFSWLLPVFENVEYLRGNLQGHIRKYLQEAGFVDIDIRADISILRLELIKATKLVYAS